MNKQLAREIFSHLGIDKILEQSIEETFKLLDRIYTQYFKNIKDYVNINVYSLMLII